MQSTELNEFIERVNERSDIYSVVSRYVQLKFRNGRYWGLCPFHSEKTASFSVSAEKGLFYCFGCGAGGNVFKFLSLIENISYFEAVKLQAERLGIDLPNRKLSPEEERRRREEKLLLNINSLAQDFYHECLIKTARGEVGRKYLAERGITPETIATFKLGFAPDEWDTILAKLTRQDFLPQQLEAVGLIAKRKNSSGYYDRFRNRVMIPIADERGHVVGFGGRILQSEDDSTPKYLNTPETALFNKRNLLFGLDKSNRAISDAGAVIVVEGYMDAISLFSAGVKNVVATLGTAFTPEHVKLIQRYAKKIFFCYDSDEAGQRATVRALPIVQGAGAEVFVIQIPDGKDPDEFIRKHGKAAFDELIKKAVPLIDYRINYVVARAELTTPYGKVRALREILPVVANVKGVVMRNAYQKKISAALVMDEQIIINEWKNFLRTAAQQVKREPERVSSAVKREKRTDDGDPMLRAACEVILRMAWHESDVLDYVLTIAPQGIFSKEHLEIIAWLKACADSNTKPDIKTAATELSEEANAQLSRILMDETDDPRTVELELFNDAINVLKRVTLKRKYDKLLKQATECSTESDDETYVKILQDALKIKREMDYLRTN